MRAFEEETAIEREAGAVADLDTTEAYLGRQPIVDRKGALVGYELLYRDDEARGTDLAATARVIINLLNGVGFAVALGEFRASINVDAGFLLSDMVGVLAPGLIVLEIFETVHATLGLVARIAALRARGFSFALDDFTRPTPENLPF